MAVQLPPVWCRMHLSQVCWEVQLSLAFELPKYHPYCPCEFMPLLCNLLTVLVGFQEGVNADIFNHHLYPKLLVYNLFLLSLFWIFFRPVCFVLIFFFSYFFWFTPPNNTPSFLNRKPSNSFSKECIPNCKHCSEHHLWPLLCAVLLSLFSIIWNIRFVLLNPRAIFKCINFTWEKKVSSLLQPTSK